MAAFGNYTPGTINVKIRTPQGVQQIDITDFGPYPIYSSATVAVGQTSEIAYFQYASGGTKPGASGTATKIDTNLRQASQLDPSGEMLIYSMRIEVTTSQGGSAAPTVSSCTLGDMNLLIAKTYSSLQISTEKPLSEGPLTFFPAGGGISGTTTQNAAEAWTNGVPQSISSRVFAAPHYLPPLTNFRVVQEFLPNGFVTNLSATRDLRVVLDGLRRRASQ